MVTDVGSTNALYELSDTMEATMIMCRFIHHHNTTSNNASGIIPGNVEETTQQQVYMYTWKCHRKFISSIYIFFNHEVWLLEYVLSKLFICKWSASKRRMAAISVPLIFALKDGNMCIEVGC